MLVLFNVVDIDTIEVQTDDDMEESGTIKARRVYNYRVRRAVGM